MEEKDLNAIYKEVQNLINGDNFLRQIENIRSSVNSLKNTEFYQEIQKIFLHCENDISDAKELVNKAITSPIYTGVIGHYSHGKSSLLNAILLSQDAKEDGLLPIGEGVVTGKPTLLQFSKDKDEHEFYKVFGNGEEELIDEEQYKQLVTTKAKGDITSVKFFRICLAPKRLAGGGHIFKSMAEIHIELLDTPGLGGPYWKDKETLREWVESFKLLILCIKATEINSKVSDQINPFLKITTSPVIVCLTFWDKWRNGEDYAGIKNEYDARKKAKDLLLKFFPTLENAVEEDRITFCSAKGYFLHNNMKPTEEMAEYYTEEWNIDNVRSVLEKYVVTKRVDILKSTPSKTTFLVKSKKEGVVKGLETLVKDYKSLRDKLLEVSNKLRPQPKVFKEIQDKFKKDARYELENILEKTIRELDNHFQKELKNGETPIPELIERLNSDFKSKIKTQLKEFRDTIEELIENKIIKPIERHIKTQKTAISLDKVDIAENVAKNYINEYIEEATKELDRKIQIFVNPDEGIVDFEKAKETLSTFIEGCKKRIGLSIFGLASIGVGLILLILSLGITNGKNLVLGLGGGGTAVGILTFIIILIAERMSDVSRKIEAKRRQLNELKRSNSREELERRIAKLYDLLDEKIEEIFTSIESDVASSQETQKEVIEEIKSIARGDELQEVIFGLERHLEELKGMK